MTRIELAQILAYLATAVGKPLSSEASEIYFDLLGDIPADVMRVAAKRVALEHRWATFPLPFELKQAAAETLQGQVVEMSQGEAWALGWNAIGKIDPDIEGSVERGFEGLNPLVAETIKALGVPALCFGREPVTVVRAQFMKVFSELQARDRKRALLAGPVTKAIEETPKRLPSQVAKAIAQVGVEP